MGLTFSLGGIIDIDAEFSYVAKINAKGWLTFEYNYRNAMEQWAEDTGVEMRLLTSKSRRVPGYAFRTDADRMMFILAWSEDAS